MTVSERTESPLYYTVSKPYKYIEKIGYAVCLITNIFGNTLTLVAMKRFPFLKSKTYITLKSLTIADLLVSLYVTNVFLIRCELIDLTDPVQLYTVGSFGGIFSYNVIFHPLLIAIDRFIAVVFPYFYSSQMPKQRLIGICVCAWMLSLVITGIYI